MEIIKGMAEWLAMGFGWGIGFGFSVAIGVAVQTYIAIRKVYKK